MSWPIAKLGDHIQVLSGFAFNSKKFSDSEGVPLIRIRDVVRGFTETYYDGEFDNKYLINQGDLLVGMDGQFNAVRWGSGKALLNQRVCKIEALEKMDERYLSHLLPNKLKEIEDKTAFVTVKHLSVKKIKAIEFPLPPIDEQKRIADILDKAEVIRLKSEKIMNLKDNIIQGIFFEMFGDPILNPKGWDKVTVKEIATIVRGSSPRPKGDPRYYGEGIPRLMVADLTRDGMYVTPSIDSLTIEGAKKSRSMMKGDLVMAVSGRPGLPAILNVDCCIHDGFAGFRGLSQNFNKVYLYHYFKLYISQVSKRSVGAIFKNITTSDIRNIELFDVSLEHQNQFAKISQKITSLNYSTLHNQVLDLKKSISQEILT